MNAAAFFDMDRTLVRCNSGAMWVKFLRENRELTLWQALTAATWIIRYKLAILDIEDATQKATATMRGDSEQELAEKCLRFAKERVFEHIADKGRAAIANHRENNHVIAILSSMAVFGERITGIEWVGIAAIGVGLGLLTMQAIAAGGKARDEVLHASGK